jgi:hypothetical protein
MAISEIGSGVTLQGASSPSSIVVTHGFTIASGDVLIASLASNDNLTAFADANGSYPFTQAWNADGAPSGNTSQNSIWYRVAGVPAEPTTYTWADDNAGQAYAVVIRQFRGVHANVWDVTPSATTQAYSTTAGTTATSSDMTIVTAGALGIAFLWTDYTGALTYSSPTNSWGTAVSCATNWPLGTYLRACASSGAIGTAQWTISASQDWEVMLGALKPSTEPAGFTGLTVKHYVG